MNEDNKCSKKTLMGAIDRLNEIVTNVENKTQSESNLLVRKFLCKGDLVPTPLEIIADKGSTPDIIDLINYICDRLEKSRLEIGKNINEIINMID